MIKINVEKNVVMLDMYTTETALNALRKVIHDGIVLPEKYSKVHIKYNLQKGINWDDSNAPSHYPVKFHSAQKDTPDVWITSLTAGYGGEGPTGTIEALKIMGFEVTDSIEEKILNRWANISIVDLTIEK